MAVTSSGADGGGLIQAGVRSSANKLYPPIAHEPTSQTGLHNVASAISLANAGSGTAQSDFFILLSDMPGLDANGPGGDANGFIHAIQQQAAGGYTWTVSPSSLFEVRFAFSHVLGGKQPPYLGGPDIAAAVIEVLRLSGGRADFGH